MVADRQNFTFWKAIVLVYFVVNTFLHRLAEIPFQKITAEFGPRSLKYGMTIMLSILLLTLIYKVWPKFVSHPDRSLITKMGLGFILASIVSYICFMGYNSEGMHFVQFGVGGILCLLAFRNVFVAICTAYLFGIVDETIQRYVTEGYYLDFNDMVLDFVGAGLGVTTAMIFFQIKKETSFTLSKSILLLIFLYAGFFFVASLTGICTYYTDDPGYFHFYRHTRAIYNPDFLYQVAWGDKWYQFRPYQGLSIIVLMPLSIWFTKKYRIN